MKKIVACILAVLDIALLVIIISSIRTEHLAGKEEDVGKTASAYQSEEKPETPQESVFPENNIIYDTEDVSEETGPGISEETVSVVEEDSAVRYDPSAYDAVEASSLGDFSWVTKELYENGVTRDVDRLSADEAKGAWKTYIIADSKESHGSMSEYFLTTYIEGDRDDPTVRLDWSYIYITEEGEGYDDTSEDTVLNGRWNGTGITADGALSLDLMDLYHEGDKEYGVGKLVNSGGMNAAVFLVRP